MMELLTKASNLDHITERELRNRDTAYRAACEGIVLLRNDGTLPFAHKKIAAFGAGVSHTVKGGTGSGEVNERSSVSIYDGLVSRGFEICTEHWIDEYRKEYEKGLREFYENRFRSINLLNPSSLMNDVLKGYQPPAGGPVTTEDTLGSGTDCCIYVVSRQAGEGGDRRPVKGDYYLTEKELSDIRLCAAFYPHFVLILNCGSVMDTSVLDEVEGINAVLYISQLGMEGGNAVADVLCGNVTPSGKLADTWPLHYEDIPFSDEYSGVNGKLGEEMYREDIYVGYRYFDTFQVRPRFAFGYGLSYTEFELSEFTAKDRGTEIVLTGKVTNTGTRPGREVVQVYVSAPFGKLEREYQSLTGFVKTKDLAPGESTPVEIVFDLRSVGGYSFEDAGFLLEKGAYVIRVGTASDATTAVATAVLESTVQLTRNAHICPRKTVLTELRPAAAVKTAPEDIPVIVMEEAIFKTENYEYRTPDPVEDERVQKFVSRLSIRDMAEVVVGAGMSGKDSRFQLPGSVGNTTSALWKKGLVNVPLCDGPAGLRIQQKSGVDSKGNVRPYEFTFSVLGCLPKQLTRAMRADEKDTPIYQYCTAFPVASALAQTWNVNLMEKIGDAVLEEMKEYGCVFWLAPAINIHRNPLCGRNFEYFSEDPLLTGKMAASLIRGVQREPGYYVTIKHFACNNQEDNRNHVSSNLTERALREIYLRGFEICVKEAGAKAVMTSYNRINGVYTANSHDLCTKVLRNEWGFEGVVMTDWLSTSPGMASSAEAMRAGNDLIMPGGTVYKAELLAGIIKRKASKADLRRCCANVVKAIMDSPIQKEYMDMKE